MTTRAVAVDSMSQKGDEISWRESKGKREEETLIDEEEEEEEEYRERKKERIGERFILEEAYP